MSKELMKELTDLNSRHRKWEDQLRVKNDELYGMLADTMRIVTDVRSDGTENTIEKILKQCEISYTNKTSLEMKVVKLALTQNSKRASSYAKVFIAAQDAGIDADGLKDWIDEKGGIEKIRLSLCDYKSVDAYFDDGKNTMAAMTALASFEVDIIDAKEDELVVMFGRVSADSKVEVLKIAGVGNEDTLVKSTVASVTKKEAIINAADEFDADELKSLKTMIDLNKAENVPDKPKDNTDKDAA